MLRQSPGWPATFHRAVAGLTFDCRIEPTFAGLRAAGRPAHRLLFQACNCEIDVELTREPARVGVRLVGPDHAGRG